MQEMLTWECLKKMCSNGKEVYQVLSAVQLPKSRASGVCQPLVHPSSTAFPLCLLGNERAEQVQESYSPADENCRRFAQKTARLERGNASVVS